MSGHRKWSEDRERYRLAVAELLERQRAYEVAHPPPSVPRWFTCLYSAWSVRRCRRRGHVLTVWKSCDRCGREIVGRVR